MTLSSALFAALVGLVLLYLVPNRARTKQVLLESRQDDRFSPELRIIARTSKMSVSKTTKKTTPKGHQVTVNPPRCGYVLTQTSPPETIMMRRPNVVADRLAAQNAAERRRRREQLQLRAAAARRRLALTLLLVVVSLTVGVVAGAGVVHAAFITIPLGLTATVLVLGRRAVVLNARADARYERLQRARAEDLDAAENSGEQEETSEPAREELVEEVVEGEPEVRVEVEVDQTWTPVPVPAPTYTMKPAAPRMEPAPLDLPEPDFIAPSAQRVDSGVGFGAEVGTDGGASDAEPIVGEEPVADAGIDLDAILDRRRAAGA